jgi:hypothetical protein
MNFLAALIVLGVTVLGGIGLLLAGSVAALLAGAVIGLCRAPPRAPR